MNAGRTLALVLCSAHVACAEPPPTRSAADVLQTACTERGDALVRQAEQQGADVVTLDQALTELHARCTTALNALRAIDAVRVTREAW